MHDAAATRRGFLTYFASVGLSSTLLPGVLWARVQQENADRITSAMLKDALAVSGLDFTDEQREQILNGVNQNLTRYADLRQIAIDGNIAPPMYFSPIVPGRLGLALFTENGMTGMAIALPSFSAIAITVACPIRV